MADSRGKIDYESVEVLEQVLKALFPDERFSLEELTTLHEQVEKSRITILHLRFCQEQTYSQMANVVGLESAQGVAALVKRARENLEKIVDSIINPSSKLLIVNEAERRMLIEGGLLAEFSAMRRAQANAGGLPLPDDARTEDVERLNLEELELTEEIKSVYWSIIDQLKDDQAARNRLGPKIREFFNNDENAQPDSFVITPEAFEILFLIYISNPINRSKGKIKIDDAQKCKVLGLLIEAMLKLPEEKIDEKRIAATTGLTEAEVGSAIGKIKSGKPRERKPGRTQSQRPGILPDFLELIGDKKEGRCLVFKGDSNSVE